MLLASRQPDAGATASGPVSGVISRRCAQPAAIHEMFTSILAASGTSYFLQGLRRPPISVNLGWPKSIENTGASEAANTITAI